MIENEVSSIRYDCNGQNNVFEVPFKFFKNVDGAPVIFQLAVYHQHSGDTDCIKLLEDIDYQVIWDEATKTGSIQTNLVYPYGDRIAILRHVIDTQDVSYRKDKPFPYEGTEHALDKITMSLQEIKDALGRTVRVPETSLEDPNSFLERAYQAAENAEKSAENSALSAGESDTTKKIVEGYIDAAKQSERLAAEQAGVSKDYSERALAILEEINQYVDKLKELKKNWLVYSSGEDREDLGYFGSLTEFPVPELVDQLGATVYLDGVWKEPVEEFLVEERKVVFPFEVPFGTRVVIQWQDSKERPLYAHNYIKSSHPYILKKIEDLQKELAAVVNIQKVEEVANKKVAVHNQDSSAHPYLLSQLSLKADKAKTYPAIDELKNAILELKNTMVTSLQLEDYYKKSGGTIGGAVTVKSSDNYVLDLVRKDKENHLKISIDNDGTILILNSDADGAHGIELRKDGTLYLRKRISGLNGYRTFKILTEEDI